MKVESCGNGGIISRYDVSYYEKGRKGESVSFWIGEAIKIAKLNVCSKILDLGCGTGLYTREFGIRIAYYNIFGLDLILK